MAPPIFRDTPVRVRVPATSANLGPGFDAVGLALSRYDEVEVQATSGGLELQVSGEGARQVPRSERHLVVRALRAGFDLVGGAPDGIRLSCHNRIPHGRGLGSSAAAIVAGLVAARALVTDAERTGATGTGAVGTGAAATGAVGTGAVGTGAVDDLALLRRATELEGHPDNVAACLFGGATIAWTGEHGAQVARLVPAAQLYPVAFIPTTRASTAQVRKLLPATIAHRDAAAAAGRAALLVHALTAAPGLLHPATEDWLHQRYREPAMPASAQLLRRLRADGVAAVISGAGPTVLAFAEPGVDLQRYRPPRWTVAQLPVDRDGAVATVAV